MWLFFIYKWEALGSNLVNDEFDTYLIWLASYVANPESSLLV